MKLGNLSNGNYIVRATNDVGSDDDNDVRNTLPTYVVAFILSNCKWFVKFFLRKMNGFYIISIFSTDTDS